MWLLVTLTNEFYPKSLYSEEQGQLQFHFLTGTETWSLLSQGGSEAPTARHRHTTVLHDNAMWAYGGMTDLQEKSDFWRFDFGKFLII